MGDVALMACYLINHMPSSVVGDQVFHSVFFSNIHLHSLTSCVFRSTCFVHNLSTSFDKSAWSLKCVFHSYRRSQKGYHCYSPTLQWYLISAYVTFFEFVPHFESTHVSPDPLPRQRLWCIRKSLCTLHKSRNNFGV